MPVSPDTAPTVPDVMPVCNVCGAVVADTDLHDQWNHGTEPDAPVGINAFTFLSRIDAERLEKAALSHDDVTFGEPHSLTRAMLTVLMEWASGRP